MKNGFNIIEFKQYYLMKGFLEDDCRITKEQLDHQLTNLRNFSLEF